MGIAAGTKHLLPTNRGAVAPRLVRGCAAVVWLVWCGGGALRRAARRRLASFLMSARRCRLPFLAARGVSSLRFPLVVCCCGRGGCRRCCCRSSSGGRRPLFGPSGCVQPSGRPSWPCGLKAYFLGFKVDFLASKAIFRVGR